MNALSKKIYSKNLEDLLSHNLNYIMKESDKGNYLGREIISVGDMWENTKAQCEENSNKIESPHISYAVYRIGLKRQLCERVN